MAACAKGEAWSQWPCGRCLICKINKSRIWSARLMLEATQYASDHVHFLTPTYEKTPDHGSLRLAHLSSSMHRLRESTRERGMPSPRFFGIGEYGKQTARPHYHVALYGVPRSELDLVQKAWEAIPTTEGYRPGFIDIGSLEPNSAAYITGYITKSHADEEFEHAGMEPQRAVMSRRPGIGMSWVPVLVEALSSHEGALYVAQHGDVPAAFQCGSRSLPLGPYMRQKLRLHLFGDHRKPRRSSDLQGLKDHVEFLSHLPPLQVDSTAFDQVKAWTEAQQTFKEIKAQRKAQRALQVTKRHGIYKQLRSL